MYTRGAVGPDCAIGWFALAWQFHAVTMLADGAKWLLEEQRKHLTHADSVLDIFHVLEHITVAGQALVSDPDKASQWIARARELLLNEGWSGIDVITRPEREPGEAPRTEAKHAVLDKLRNHLSLHANHLHYAERLREGSSIGSGRLEDACKNLIGRRLKANVARWRVRRVNRMSGVCSLAYATSGKPAGNSHEFHKTEIHCYTRKQGR